MINDAYGIIRPAVLLIAQVQQGGDIFIMDYFLAALDGANGEYYVPGSFPCANNTKYFEIDVTRTSTNFRMKPDAVNTLEGTEDVLFNATATFSGHLPDAIYYCYFVPGTAYRVWTAHYKTFLNLRDFEGAFIQNIMGNFLTFIDIYQKMAVASDNGDYLSVVYQISRFARRLLDFKSMLRASSSSVSKDEIITLYRLTSYLNYYASLGDYNNSIGYPGGRSKNME